MLAPSQWTTLIPTRTFIGLELGPALEMWTTTISNMSVPNIKFKTSRPNKVWPMSDLKKIRSQFTFYCVRTYILTSLVYHDRIYPVRRLDDGSVGEVPRLQYVERYGRFVAKTGQDARTVRQNAVPGRSRTQVYKHNKGVTKFYSILCVQLAYHRPLCKNLALVDPSPEPGGAARAT